MLSQVTSSSRMWAICVLLIVVLASYVVYPTMDDTSYADGNHELAAADHLYPSPNQASSHIMTETKSAIDGSELEAYIRELVDTLRSNHLHEQADILFQVRLKEIYDELTADHPVQGRIYFEKTVQLAFPDFVESIMALMEKLVRYDEWLLENLPDLNVMELDAQQEMIWQQRFEIFGKQDAEAIWNAELPEDDVRYEAVQDTLALLQKSKGMAMEDRVNTLMNAFDQHYSAMEELIVESKGVIAQSILGLEVVQEELSALSVSERQEQINNVRRLLEFSEEDIAYLEIQDQKSEREWQNGYAYMAARARLESELTGSDLAKTLDSLREKYFQHRAGTIKKEEEQLGFFRYARERMYGVN